MDVSDISRYNPFPKLLEGSPFKVEPFWGGGGKTKKLKQQLAREKKTNKQLNNDLRTQHIINTKTSAQQREKLLVAQHATAASEEQRRIDRQQAAVVKNIEVGEVKKTEKEKNEEKMMDILMGVKQEPFAVAFTNPNPNVENNVMLELYKSITECEDPDDEEDPCKEENWNAEYDSITTNDYADFYNDVRDTFNEKYDDISRNIVSLNKLVEQYNSFKPLDTWVHDNSNNLAVELESLAVDTETNERRAEYENQIIEANNRWRLVVIAIYIMAVCVFLFYEVRDLIATYSFGKAWSIVWRLALMGVYLLSVDYMFFHFWTIVRYALDTLRRIIHV